MSTLTRCWASEQIAAHCNEPEQEVYACWHCGEEEKEDNLTEVKTRDNGYQSIGECCFDEYYAEGV